VSEPCSRAGHIVSLKCGAPLCGGHALLTDCGHDSISERRVKTDSSAWYIGRLKPNAGADSRRGSYIPTLDGWRAISIALVIVSHALPGAPYLASLGTLGVSVFFAISGYLICTLLLKEHERNGSISLGGFYTRRAFRILPPAMTYMGVLLILGLAPMTDVMRCVFVAANYSVLASSYLGHFWSLSMEEHFYLFWPTILTLLRPRRAAMFAGVAIPVVLGWRLWALTHAQVGIFYHRTDVRLDAFFAPCLLAILLHRSRRLQEKLKRWLSPATILGLAGLLALTFFASRWEVHIEAVQKTLQSLTIPLIVTGTVLNSGSWLGKLLELSLLRLVGRISYSLYLWQEFAVVALPAVPIAIRLTGSLVAAVASYYLIEQPFIRLGARLRQWLAPRR
jgi:peptidoglycan/LPS O-acetylase OafA/YrhL